MSNISNIKKLRELTGAPMGDCKSALIENNQDLEAARLFLKKKGLLVGVLRGDKDTSQGIVIASTTNGTSEKNKDHFGTIICLSCESDSVAKLNTFVECANEIAQYTIENVDITLEKLQKEFEEKLSELMSTIKENIKLSYYSHLSGNHISVYNHQTHKLSVLVKFNKEPDEQVGKNIAMQVAGMKPLFVDYDDIPQSVLDAEKKLAIEKTKEDKKNKDKTPELIEKISKGRLDKAMDEMTLLNQQYTQAVNEKGDPIKQTVRQYLESLDKELKIIVFSSFKLG